MTVTKLYQNCTLIWCTKTREAALIDPGGEKHRLIKEIKNFDVNIKYILLTHGHIDHVGAAYELSKYYNIIIMGPQKEDKLLLNNLIIQCNMFNIERVPPFVPNNWLTDGDIISLGYEKFHVIHCPGHSPGHIIFLNKKRKLAITGDVIFKGSIGRADFPYSNNNALINSIKNKLMTLSDDFLFLPGHGCFSTIGYERTHNTFIK